MSTITETLSTMPKIAAARPSAAGSYWSTVLAKEDTPKGVRVCWMGLTNSGYWVKCSNFFTIKNVQL